MACWVTLEVDVASQMVLDVDVGSMESPSLSQGYMVLSSVGTFPEITLQQDYIGFPQIGIT